MFKKIVFSLFMTSFSLTSISFAQQYGTPASYSYIIESNQGVIVGKRMIQFESADCHAEGAGTAVGAVSGGLLGSTIGKGSGHIAGALGGAVIGGILGNSVGRSIHRQKDCYMYEYTIRLNSGALISIWQNLDINLPIGQNVQYERSNDGRGFLIPQYY